MIKKIVTNLLTALFQGQINKQLDKAGMPDGLINMTPEITEAVLDKMKEVKKNGPRARKTLNVDKELMDIITQSGVDAVDNVVDELAISSVKGGFTPIKHDYFKPSEFISPNDTGMSLDKLTIDPVFLERLNYARFLANKPWRITSGQRSKEYNKLKGGVAGSAHEKGRAADISATTGAKKFEIVSCAMKAGFPRIGIAKDFIHLDWDLTKPQNTIWLY